MSERRHVMMGVDESSLPDWFKEHIVCWYDPKRQGATNESLAENPVLVDLSGKGRDMTLVGFQGQFLATDGSLYFNGRRLAVCNEGFVLTDFTCIIDRSLYKQPTTTSVFSKWNRQEQTLPIIGIAHEGNYPTVEVYNFGHRANNLSINTSRTTDMLTPSSYNGTPIARGSDVDLESAKLVIGGSRIDVPDYYKEIMNLYSFLLFSKTLTAEQIQWVKDNLITE